MFEFYKYHGAGNDFIFIDNRQATFEGDEALIAHLCDRRRGIGADGLVLLYNAGHNYFEMEYYNKDGKVGSMCGNAGRCIIAFAAHLRIIESTGCFLAADGYHKGSVLSQLGNKMRVLLAMNDVPFSQIQEYEDGMFIDTGSPHFVVETKHVSKYDVLKHGRKLRKDARFPDGVNVDFVEVNALNQLFVRTYERGVEEETLSCGTGVTAAAIWHIKQTNRRKGTVNINTLGGDLTVKARTKEDSYTDILLEGDTCLVYKGEWIDK
ncbi:MAG: diaminopimelate epimerase [Bacteroidales bacterium]|jgi:diaminopimelate epimerase|nr:diaminopimelate epimerase [Bacteroidales bacterium]